jgi:Fur family ferric uptake transcriptional regulator
MARLKIPRPEDSRGNGYSTRQGKLLVDYLASLDGIHVTVNDIAGHFRYEDRQSIGLTTIYRHLERLVNAGTVRKYVPAEGESACYQYMGPDEGCAEHFHLKCEQCGRLIHLRCDLLEKIRDHIKKEHRFRINILKTVFYGKCGDCGNRPEENGKHEGI